MKKYIILMLLVLVGSVTFAQLGGGSSYTKTQSDAKYAPKANPIFTGTPKISSDTISTKAYARSVGGGGVDTITLSNRIDQKLNKADTITLSDRIDLKLNIADTTAMLAPYLKTGEAVTDTTSLSNRIDLKLAIADTTAMLAPYLKMGEAVTDTTSLSNRIDLKLNKTDTTTLSSRIDLKADSTYLSNLSENVQQGLDIRLDSLLSDAKYVLKGDSASLYDYVFSKAQSDSIYENQFFNFWKYHGFPKMLSLPFLSYTSWGSSQTMADGSLYVVLHKMNKDTVITKLNTFTFVAGNYTGDVGAYNGMLVYTVNSTGINEVARTTNDTEIWKTAGSSKITKTLDTPVTVTKGQWIGIGCIYNNSAQTTAPQLPSMGSISANLFYQMTTTYRLVSVKTGVADPASSYTWGNLAVGTQLIGIWPE